MGVLEVVESWNGSLGCGRGLGGTRGRTQMLPGPQHFKSLSQKLYFVGHFDKSLNEPVKSLIVCCHCCLRDPLLATILNIEVFKFYLKIFIVPKRFRSNFI